MTADTSRAALLPSSLANLLTVVPVSVDGEVGVKVEAVNVPEVA